MNEERCLNSFDCWLELAVWLDLPWSTIFAMADFEAAS